MIRRTGLAGLFLAVALASAAPSAPCRRRRRFLQGQDRPGDHRHRRRRHLRRLRPAGGAAFRPLHSGPSDGGDAVDAGGGRLHRAQLARHRGAARRHRRHHRPHQHRARGPVQQRGEVRSARIPVARALHELRLDRRCLARNPASARSPTPRRARSRPARPGSQSVPAQAPTILNKIAGTKFKVVAGYRSTGESFLALERGEVDVAATSMDALRSLHWPKLESGELDRRSSCRACGG